MELLGINVLLGTWMFIGLGAMFSVWIAMLDEDL